MATRRGRPAAPGRHPRRRECGGRLGRLGQLRAQRAGRRRATDQGAHPRGGARRLGLPREPAGAGPATRADQHVRAGRPQLLQPVLPRRDARRRAGGRRGRARRLLVLDSQYSVELEQQQVREMAGPARAGAGHRAGRRRRVDPAVAERCARVRPRWRSTRRSRASTGSAGSRPDNATAVEVPVPPAGRARARSIAFLSAPRPLTADPDRLRHYRRVIRALGLRPRVVYAPAVARPACRRPPARCSAGPDAPTAVVTNSDYAAHAVYKAARELGARGRAGGVRRRARRPADLRAARPAAEHRARRPPGDGARADDRGCSTTAVSEDYVAPVEYVERAIPSRFRSPLVRARRSTGAAGPRPMPDGVNSVTGSLTPRRGLV